MKVITLANQGMEKSLRSCDIYQFLLCQHRHFWWKPSGLHSSMGHWWGELLWGLSNATNSCFMREGRIGRYTAGRRGKETFPWMSWWSCLSFCRWSSVLCSVMMAIAGHDDTAPLILVQEDIKPSAVHCTQSAPWCYGNLLHNNIYITPRQQKKQPIFKVLDKNQLKKKKRKSDCGTFSWKGNAPISRMKNSMHRVIMQKHRLSQS